MPFQIDDTAITGTAVAAVAAICYKVFLRLRGDRRADLADARTDKAYASVLEELRAEVGRLSSALSTVSASLDAEIYARRVTQEENAKLRGRVTTLEHEIAGLEREVKRLREAQNG